MLTILDGFWVINPWLLIFLVAWSLAWKGLALWRAARTNQPTWFVILLLLNTLGILEIIYLFLLNPVKKQGPTLSGKAV